jgi:hypothetical protein
VPESIESVNDSLPAEPGFQGTIDGRVTIDGTQRTFQIVVGAGFSTDGPNVVGDLQGTMRIQQRLRHLGYRELGEERIVATGEASAGTFFSVKLFNAAVRGTGYSSADSFFADLRFINSPAAPRWDNLATGFFEPSTVCEFLGQQPGCNKPERYGTSWLQGVAEVVRDTIESQSLAPLPQLYSSGIDGGEVRDRTVNGVAFLGTMEGKARLGSIYDAGLKLDYDLPTPENATSFFKKRVVDGKSYIAAKTPNDPAGDSHHVVWQSFQAHTAKLTAAT